jgi:predicted membrane-bound spermidine synthase
MSSRFIALSMSFLTGLLALSLEIIWIRIVDFTRHGQADSFGLVLFAFLSGIAVGALLAGQLARKKDLDVFKVISRLLLISALLSYVSIPLVAEAVTLSDTLGFGLSLLLIALVAGTFGMIFPLLCHVAMTADEPEGRAVSHIYMANILGATLSPLLTGLYLFDKFSLPEIIAAVTATSVVAALFLYINSAYSNRRKLAAASVLILVATLVLQVHAGFYRNIYEKLLFKDRWKEKQSFKYVVENRSGLITVEAKTNGGDVIYGGGVWDGRFHIDPAFPVNGIDRAYMVAALHRAPREVLEIGLASGSWALVLDAYEPIESLDIVEINSGYPEVIRHYPDQSRIFESDKTKLHIDDGRRWLKRNPDRKFDLIVADVSWHERNNITNLISANFLHILKSHLKPGGVVYYNTTNSEDVIFTAAQVFQHIVRYDNHIAVSDAPFAMSKQETWDNMQRFVKQPIRAMYDSWIYQRAFRDLANQPLIDIAVKYRGRSGLVKITDDNMATEYRRTRLTGGTTWFSFLEKVWLSS